jgi:hypothetical protein
MTDPSTRPPASARSSEQPRHRGFGAALLAAMHEWRERQAMREIDHYRHLIDDSAARELRRTFVRAHPSPDQSKTRAQSARVSPTTAFIVAAVAVLAVLYTVGGVMIMQRSAGAPGETRADTMLRD